MTTNRDKQSTPKEGDNGISDQKEEDGSQVDKDEAPKAEDSSQTGKAEDGSQADTNSSKQADNTNSSSTASSIGMTKYDLANRVVGLFKAGAPAIILVLFALVIFYFGFQLLQTSTNQATEQFRKNMDLMNNVQAQQVKQFENVLSTVGKSTLVLNTMREEINALAKEQFEKRSQLEKDRSTARIEQQLFEQSRNEVRREVIAISKELIERQSEIGQTLIAKKLENADNEEIIRDHANTIRRYSEYYDSIFEKVFQLREKLRPFDPELVNEIAEARGRLPIVRYENAISQYIENPQKNVKILNTLNGISAKDLLKQINGNLDSFDFLIKFELPDLGIDYIFGALGRDEYGLKNTVSFQIFEGTVKRFNAQKRLFGLSLLSEQNVCENLWAIRTHKYFQHYTNIIPRAGTADTWKFTDTIRRSFKIGSLEILKGEEPALFYLSGNKYRELYSSDYKTWIENSSAVIRPKENFELERRIFEFDIDKIDGIEKYGTDHDPVFSSIKHVINNIRNDEVSLTEFCKSMNFTAFGEAMSVMFRDGFSFEQEGSLFFSKSQQIDDSEAGDSRVKVLYGRNETIGENRWIVRFMIEFEERSMPRTLSETSPDDTFWVPTNVSFVIEP